MIMDKCRICLRYRKKLRSIFEEAEGITFADMITSIANVKIRNEEQITDKLCCSCLRKLTEAYNFKICIERSELALQETSNLKRISFSNLNDIKIKIEIETDCKPIMPSMENFSDKLFKEGLDSISYNNTVIKKIEKLSNDNKKKSLSVVEFLNSIKTESDNDCNYQDYEIDVDDYNSDSGSNYSYDNKVSLNKTKKKITKKKKESKNYVGDEPIRKNWIKYPCIKPIKPKYMEDLRLVRTEVKITRKPKQPRRSSSSYAKQSVCPYCGKLSKSLNTHILVHTAERKFKCDQCTKGFFTVNALNTHKKLHSQDKNFKCELCIAAFHCKGSLRSHMLMHRDEKKHVCDICNKAFKRKSILQRHMMIHNFGTKPIKCELCPMTFYTQYSLRHHLRVHTGERPFRCEICSQPYSYKHDFNRHCLKKHGVFLKRRSVHVMNEEVLQQERALMRDLALRAHGITKCGEKENPFDGPQAGLAYELAMKAIEANKIPIIF